MNPKKWFVIGISGATCGGKTTLTNQIHQKLKNSVVLRQDDYFLPADDPRHTKIPELNHLNWEILTSMDMDKFHADIFKVIESVPDGHFAETGGKPVLIIDGFLLFKCKAIADLCDVKYFLTITREECWERRRGRIYDPPDIPGYFEQVVWPEYIKHETEVRTDRDLCKKITFIDGSKDKEEIFQIVFSEVKRILL